jgi:hypothetical protein
LTWAWLELGLAVIGAGTVLATVGLAVLVYWIRRGKPATPYVIPKAEDDTHADRDPSA